MPIIYHATGRRQQVQNLGWLLRNWKKVRFIVAHEHYGEGNLVAYFHDRAGRFEADFADYSVLLEWLDRPVFRGLPLRLSASDRGDNEMIGGSEEHRRAIANMRGEAQRRRAKDAAEKLVREKSVYDALIRRETAQAESVVTDGRTLLAYSSIRKEMVTIAAWMGVHSERLRLWVTSDDWASPECAVLTSFVEKAYIDLGFGVIRQMFGGGETIVAKQRNARTDIHALEIIRSPGDAPPRMEIAQIPLDNYPDEKRFLPAIVDAIVRTIQSSLGMHYRAEPVVDVLSRHPQRIRGYAYNWHILREAVAYGVGHKLNREPTEQQLDLIMNVIEGMKTWPIEKTPTFTFPIPKDSIRLIEMDGGGFTVPREIEMKFDPRLVELRDMGWTGPAPAGVKMEKIKLPDEEEFLNLVMLPDGTHQVRPGARFKAKALPPVPGAEVQRLIDMRKRVRAKPGKEELAPPTEEEVTEIGAALAPMLHKMWLAEDVEDTAILRDSARSVLTTRLWARYQQLRRRLHETQVDSHWKSAFEQAIAWLYVSWSKRYEFEWEDDADFRLEPEELEEMTDEVRREWERGEHTVLCATLFKYTRKKGEDYLRRDNTESLCGIIDAEADYMREIEADLAVEGVEEAETLWEAFFTGLKQHRSEVWARMNPRGRLIDLGPGKPRAFKQHEKPRAIEMDESEPRKSGLIADVFQPRLIEMDEE